MSVSYCLFQSTFLSSKNGYLLWKVFHNSSKFFSGLRMIMAVSILAPVREMQHQLQHRFSLSCSRQAFRKLAIAPACGCDRWSSRRSADDVIVDPDPADPPLAEHVRA